MEPGQQGRQPASRQRQLAQLPVQVLGALVELRALVDDEAQHLLLDLVERQGARQGEQRQSVRLGGPPRLGRDATQDGRPGHALPGERFQQAGEGEARVDRVQHLRVDQQQLAAAQRGKGRLPGAQRRAPHHLSPGPRSPRHQLRALR